MAACWWAGSSAEGSAPAQEARLSGAAVSGGVAVPVREVDDGGGFRAPLARPLDVVRPFAPPSSAFGPGHRGVDLGGEAGEPVLAPGAGTVRFAGDVAGRPVVSIEHAGGLRTTYEPVRPAVAAGAAVAPGQVIGHLEPGHLGCTTAACLHWGAKRGEEPLNPLGLLSGGRVRLLPW